MKKMMLLVLMGLLAFMVACGEDAASDELDKNDTEKSEAKTDEEATPASSEGDSSQSEEEAKQGDIWTYYEDADWSDDFNGLKTEIQKVVVTDKAPTMEDENAQESAVGVKFKVENTTEEKFTTYPDQATLVTSTGEQVEASMWMSDDIGGEIDKGVIKEGDVIFYLERGEAEKIEWVKLEWTAMPGSMEDFNIEEQKDYEVELQLK